MKFTSNILKKLHILSPPTWEPVPLTTAVKQDSFAAFQLNDLNLVYIIF